MPAFSALRCAQPASWRPSGDHDQIVVHVAGNPGPSDAYTTSALGVIPIGLTPTTIMSVDVPAGQYVMTATLLLRLPTSSSNAFPAGSCSLSPARVAAREFYFISDANFDRMTLINSVTVSEPTTISVSCDVLTSLALVKVETGKLNVIKVGAIH